MDADWQAYFEEESKSGKAVLCLERNAGWVQYERWAVERRPVVDLEEPPRGELRAIFWRLRAAVASYIVAPTEGQPANSTLYLCRNPAYRLENLTSTARRDIRRGLRNFEMRRLDWGEILRGGFQAFQETRSRLGLSDGTEAEFLRRFGGRGTRRFAQAWGVTREGRLSAWLSTLCIGDYAEIDGGFSRTEDLPLCPNSALLYEWTSSMLRENPRRCLSYGLSSIQSDADDAGLHRYKLKMGYQAVPVCRVFLVRPLLRPLANRLTLAGLKGLLALRPGSRRLRKARGVLESLIQRPVKEHTGSGMPTSPKELEGQ